MPIQTESKDLKVYFQPLSQRTQQKNYFFRINGYSDEVKEFLIRYYQAARKSGVVIEGRIQNPSDKNLSYYQEIMGNNFVPDAGFIETSLRKWLPRMKEVQRRTVATAMFNTLNSLKAAGKNENMLKNAYIKFMCWLYYKFEPVVKNLGDEDVPKILYAGSISNYELLLIRVLAAAGCDILLLQPTGDSAYLQLDPTSNYSQVYAKAGMGAFPQDFSIENIRQEIQTSMNRERMYGTAPSVAPCTNAWIKGKAFEDIIKPLQARGEKTEFFYNAFIRMNGCPDKMTYQNDLYQLQLQLKNSKRHVVIEENTIPKPTSTEIAAISRGNYTKADQMIMDLQKNIRYTANIELQRIMVKGFVDIMLAESALPGMNVNKLSSRAVYLLCWLKRFQEQLFSNWKWPEVGCFIYLGGCKTENEVLFLRFLASLPVDILILNPNLNLKCQLEDNRLYEENYQESLVLDKYPLGNADMAIATTAYHAERELDTIMYQNSGIYRNQQYMKANAITLQTMYEEIDILWKQEMKYRPNFSTEQDIVNMPVVFAKVCGVKHSDTAQYWKDIKELITPETIVVTKPNYIDSSIVNPMKSVSTEFFKNRKLQKNIIKNHPAYQYGVLREEMQNYILDKLEIMISQQLIKGTLQNGMEYTVIATVLNLPKEIVRLIQKFDFTKVNPKMIYINTTEENISLEDTIVTSFLNLIGFDIVFYIPTGYQTIEKYSNKSKVVEHQCGEYLYDLTVPDMKAPIKTTERQARKNLFFRRGK